MSEHSIVFRCMIHTPSSSKEHGGGAITYEQMMNTFDRTRREGKREGWQAALTALREAREGAKKGDVSEQALEDLIRTAAESRHCPDFS